MKTKYPAGPSGHDISRRHWLGAAAAAVGSISIGGLAGCGGGGAAGGASAGIASTAPDPAPVVSGAPVPAYVPAPAPAPSSGFLNPSLAESSWTHVSKALHTRWARAGGDWVDAKGVVHGQDAAINVTLAASNEVDISAIDGDLFIHPNQAQWGEPMIDGQPAVAFWTDDTNAGALPPVEHEGRSIFPFRAPVIVLNPTRGKKLTFRTIYVGSPMRIDKVRGPAIRADLPMIPLEGAVPPDLGVLDTLTEAALFAEMGQGAGVGPAPGSIWAYDASNGVDAAHGSMPYLRCAITPGNCKGIGWFWHMAPKNEAYLRYCLWIEDDVSVGMNELGVKLPGFEGGEMSWRLEHGRPDPANPGLFAPLDYRYSAESGPGFGTIESLGGSLLRTGKWHVFEEHFKNNTFAADGTPNRDGVAEVWINGHLCYSTKTVLWNSAAASGGASKFFVNIYHGGTTPPKQNIHYRIAMLARSTTRIGVPRELLAA